MNPDWRTRYELAIEAARKAGDLARSYYESTFEVEQKADTSPVTIADRQAEQLIRALIAAALSRRWACWARNSEINPAPAASAG